MPKPARSSRRSLIFNLLGVALAFGLLAFVVRQNRAKIQEVFAKPVHYPYFAIGMFVYFAALMITFARWHRLVRAQGLDFRLVDAVRLGFIGNVFNLVIPGAVGGDVIKAAFLCRMHPEDKPKAVASMILDRVLGLLGLFLLAGVAGLASWRSADPQVRLLVGLVWGAIGSVVAVLAVVFSPSLYRPMDRLVAGRPKLAGALRKLEEIGLAYRERLGTVAAMLGLAILSHSLFVLAFFAASAALFDRMPTLAEHYLMVPLALFTTAVPLPFGALGLSESISGKLFEMVHHSEGAIAMMAFRILMYANGAVSAFVYLANLRQVRTLEKGDGALGVEGLA